jgi:hypothetical protein
LDLGFWNFDSDTDEGRNMFGQKNPLSLTLSPLAPRGEREFNEPRNPLPDEFGKVVVNHPIGPRRCPQIMEDITALN